MTMASETHALPPLLTVEDVLDLEIGASERRVLRELLRAGERGLGEREILTAIYIKWPDCERRVRRGMRQSYVKKILHDLRTALEDVSVVIVPTEFVRRRPKRWVIGPRQESERVPLAHVIPAESLQRALQELPSSVGDVVRCIAATEGHGISGPELVSQLYPVETERPRYARSVVSVRLSEARAVLRRHQLDIVVRPPGGVYARRYLVRTK